MNYGYEHRVFDLGKYGKLDFAHWLHPMFIDRVVREKDVDNLSKVITLGSTVIDVGTQTGGTTACYAIAVGEEGTVIGFEPNPYVFPVLEQNAKFAKYGNIVPVNYGIIGSDSAEPVKRVFHYTDESFCNGGFASSIAAGRGSVGYGLPLEVECVNLEMWMKKFYPERYSDVSFIKIDTEGFDKEILKSIRDIVSINRPIIQVERFPFLSAEEMEDLYNTILSLGYSCYDFCGYDISTIGQPATLEEFTKPFSLPCNLAENFLEVLCLPNE